MRLSLAGLDDDDDDDDEASGSPSSLVGDCGGSSSFAAVRSAEASFGLPRPPLVDSRSTWNPLGDTDTPFTRSRSTMDAGAVGEDADADVESVLLPNSDE